MVSPQQKEQGETRLPALEFGGQPSVVGGYDYYFGSIEPSTIAPMMPGIQPIMVNNVTTRIAPQPLSSTANGGSKIAKINLPQPIV